MDHAVQHDRGALRFVLILFAAAVVLVQLPRLGDVRVRNHAVQRHGTDAITARRRVFNCRPEHLRSRYCPRSERYGPSTVFWCEEPDSSLCPGLYVTMGGIEKTAFIRPCYQWEECR